MKILIVTTVQATIDAFLTPYIEYYRLQGWYVDVATSLKRSADATHLSIMVDNLYDLPLCRKLLCVHKIVNAGFKLKKIARDNSYDIVHVHTPIASFVVRLFLGYKNNKYKIVYTAHGFHFGWGKPTIIKRLYHCMERWLSTKCSAIITINNNDYISAQNFNTNCSVHKHPGIGLCLDFWNEASVDKKVIAKIREEHNISPSDIVFVLIAEFNKGKRHMDVIEAINLIENINIKVLFLGGGRLIGKCKTQVKKYGLEKNIIFVGHTNYTREFLWLARALLHPSEREGLPRAILEAMAMNRAVICSNTRGCVDLINHHANGLIHDVGEINAIVKHINVLANNPSLAHALGRWNTKHMQEYSIENMLNMHKQLFLKLK